MTTERYLVVRKPRALTGAGAPQIRTTFGAPRMGPGPFDVVDLTEAHLTVAQANDARRDPDAIVVRSGVPIRPISPLPPGVGSAGPARHPTHKTTALGAGAAPRMTWGLSAIGASETRYDGAGVRVAVLDSGLAAEHPAFSHLRDRIIGKNFTGGSTSDITDTLGHGTHCAGTLCGGVVDGLRIGVAPAVDALIVGKVYSGLEGGDTATLIEALRWTATQDAHVVSMSFGLDFVYVVRRYQRRDRMPFPQAVSMALRDYRESLAAIDAVASSLEFDDVLLVAAAGNEANRPSYTVDIAPPALAHGVISVGAVERSPAGLRVWERSNTRCTLSAPGRAVVSATPSGTRALAPDDGTSMAAPHVAGAAALWRQHLEATQASAGLAALRERLRASATVEALAPGYREDDVGAGLVQLPAG